MNHQHKRKRRVTIVVHRDGELETTTIRLPRWLLRFVGTTGAVVLFLVVLGAILYAPIVRTAARVPGLNREIDRLTRENEQVLELARTLEDLETSYSQVRSMLGADIVPASQIVPSGTDDLPTALAVFVRPPGSQRDYEDGPSRPTHWPIDTTLYRGVVTRGQVVAGSGGEAHPGVDVAVRMGTPIRAAGGGEVVRAGNDPEYGLFVLIQHPDGYQTMYGHASRLLVSQRDSVSAGQVIALSGSTGRSTAPHLHFEMRRGDLSIDPLAVIFGKES